MKGFATGFGVRHPAPAILWTCCIKPVFLPLTYVLVASFVRSNGRGGGGGGSSPPFYLRRCPAKDWPSEGNTYFFWYDEARPCHTHRAIKARPGAIPSAGVIHSLHAGSGPRYMPFGSFQGLKHARRLFFAPWLPFFSLSNPSTPQLPDPLNPRNLAKSFGPGSITPFNLVEAEKRTRKGPNFLLGGPDRGCWLGGAYGHLDAHGCRV